MHNINSQNKNNVSGIFLESDNEQATLEYILPEQDDAYPFFCLFKTDEHSLEYKTALKHLVATTKKYYISNAFEDYKQQEKHFEETIKEVNNSLSSTGNDVAPDYEIVINDEQGNQKQFDIPKEIFSGIIGTIIGDNLYVADCGNINLRLFKQQTRIVHSKKITSYNLIDILKQISANAAKTITTKKIFSKIISGPIASDDILFISNIEHINQIENIKKYFLSADLNVAKNDIHKQLKHAEWLFLVKAVPIISYEATTEMATKVTTATSAMRDETYQVLQKIMNQNEEASPDISTKKNISHYITNISTDIVKKLKEPIYTTLKHGKKILTYTKRVSTDEPTSDSNTFTSQQKILSLAFTTVLIVLVIGAISYMKPKSQLLYNNNLAIILANHTLAQQKLIIKENDSANKILKETSLLIHQLHQDTSSQKTEFTKLLEKNNTLLKQANNILDVKEPKTLANLDKNISGISMLQAGVTQNKGRAKFFAHDYNTVYQFDNQKNTITPHADINATNTRLVSDISDEGIILFFNLAGDITALNTYTKKIASFVFTTKLNSSPTDLLSYNNKIYALLAQENTIIKYQPAGTKLTGVTYLKANVDLKTAKSMAIDGNIYVLLSNGEVLKFFQGQQVEFTIKNLSDKLLAPTKIKTNISYKNLYILDPASKRIVALDKNGNLQAQYYSENFSDLKDIAVDETNKKIYILDTNKIYSINLNL